MKIPQKMHHILIIVVSIFSTTYSYDHFKLVQHWPTAFCILNPCNPTRFPLPREFKIHGLWPDNFNGPQLAYCPMPSTDYDYKLFVEVPFRTRLDNDWIDLERSHATTVRYQDVWHQQWEKHGKCGISNFNQTAYFNKAIELKSQFNLFSILQQNGISNGGTVDLRAVNTSITIAIGEKPIIRCKVDTHNANRRLLSEIVLCFDPNGIAVVDCGQTTLQNCGSGHVLFP
ncbi:Ribonuclease, T2 family [Handroanthus impetiginosus]|uniref:Ribonuclease, T2 family n=1 Tax=Handroanthus impetiginosus TaxID=429701 RepID=A0A2G9FZP8_9LAMI|nr:Ribonuclease, T2 family [Handroanthus impetiginosus]